MNPALLALFIRSLREDARGQATYWARAGLGCFLLLVMAIFALPARGISAPGLVFFSVVIGFQIAAISLMGLSYFSSAIAEEKEEQTLGLLRMTGLSPLSILLGKSTSRLCGALLMLAAQFPFTIIAVTLGGISLGQVVAAYCAVGAFIFLLCNLALLGSVLARGTAGAAVFCLIVIGLVLGVVPLLNGLEWLAVNGFNRHLSLDRVANAIWSVTPIARLTEVLETGYHGGAVGWQVMVNVAFGVGCFLLAWAVFQRFCEREIEGPGTATRAVASVMVNSMGVRLRGLRVPRPWRDALAWKDFYFLWGGRMGFIIRTLLYGGVLACDGWAVATKGTAFATYGFGVQSIPLMPMAFSIDLSVMAARVFRTELRDQTFSTLAMLPCDIRDIVHRKVWGCFLAAAPGAFCSLGIQILFLAFMRDSTAAGTNMSIHTIWGIQVVTGWLGKVFVIVLIAWLSLYMKRGALPAGWFLSFVASTLVSIIGMLILTATSFAFLRGSPVLIVYGLPAITAGVGLLVSWILYLQGIQRLQSLAGEE